MKKNLFYTLGLIAIVVCFAGCEDDNDNYDHRIFGVWECVSETTTTTNLSNGAITGNEVMFDPVDVWEFNRGLNLYINNQDYCEWRMSEDYALRLFDGQMKPEQDYGVVFINDDRMELVQYVETATTEVKISLLFERIDD